MFSDRTMEAMDAALRGGQDATEQASGHDDPSEHFQVVSKRFPDPYEDTCCGECPMGTTCYVDQLTGA